MADNDEKRSTLDIAEAREIRDTLRRAYDNIASEPLPDNLLELIQKIHDKEAHGQG